jgi:predicted RNA-binding Zn-ribbon protein involved in translation (DUF1610 family)
MTGGYMDIKPIETMYKGYRMRSRLEARWAVFFDALGIEWEYEPEGYGMDKEFYLPDFYLPEFGKFIEIKAIIPTGKEFDKLKEFSLATNKLYIIVGNPYIHGIDEDYKKEYDFYRIWKSYRDNEPTLNKEEETCFMRCLQCGRIIIDRFSGSRHGENSYYCIYCDVIDRNTQGIPDLVYFHKGDLMTDKYMPLNGGLFDAYKKARKARFEHGETP